MEKANTSGISKARSYEEIAQFWDTHSLADYEEQTYEVDVRPTNLRARRRREQRRLLWAVIFFLILGGGVAVALAYGSRAPFLGLLCLLAAAGVLVLLWFILLLIERWAG